MVMKLSLAPFDHLIINGCLAQNGDRRSCLVLKSMARVVRPALVMLEEEVGTPHQQLYFTIQQAYAGPEEERQAHLDALPQLFATEKRRAARELRRELKAVEKFTKQERWYDALVMLKSLIEWPAEAE